MYKGSASGFAMQRCEEWKNDFTANPLDFLDPDEDPFDDRSKDVDNAGPKDVEMTDVDTPAADAPETPAVISTAITLHSSANVNTAISCRTQRINTQKSSTYFDKIPRVLTGVNRLPIPARLSPNDPKLAQAKIFRLATALGQSPFPVTLKIHVRTQSAKSFIDWKKESGFSKKTLAVSEVPTISELFRVTKDFRVNATWELGVQAKLALRASILSQGGEFFHLTYIQLRTALGNTASGSSDPEYAEFLMTGINIVENLKVKMEEEKKAIDVDAAIYVQVVIIHDLSVEGPTGRGLVGMNMMEVYEMLDERQKAESAAFMHKGDL